MSIINNPMPRGGGGEEKGDGYEFGEVFNKGTPIQEFFASRSVLITGGTGFFGKVLIDKLLRTCPNIDNLYLLVRNKKGKDMETRVEEIFKDLIFDRLKQEVPKFRYKIIGVSGDCGLPDLGISAEDRATIVKNVSVVFHCAATVRFDEKLKIAVGINVAGTKEMVNLCKDLSELKALVHVSTAYANCNVKQIDEKFYNPTISGENLIKLAECTDEGLLDSITPQVLGDWPNTYAFTKCVAENIIIKSAKDLPAGVFRPAVVVATSKEPVPGWIDNLYGPNGVVLGVGAGLLRIMQTDSSVNANLVPVDLSVNALIATAWDVGVNKYDEPPIFNFVSSTQNPITWGEFLKINRKLGEERPTQKSIWYPTISLTKYKLLFYIYSLFMHLIPACIVDLGLFVSGRKPKLLHAYKKINKFLHVISYFNTQEWTFTDYNTQTLWTKLSATDQSIFHFDIRDINWEAFFAVSLDGMRLHIFKDDPKTIPEALKKLKRLKFLHYLIIYSFYGLVLWLLYTMMASVIY